MRRRVQVVPTKRGPIARGWPHMAPWVIGWVFFDRLLSVFALPAIDGASGTVQAVVIGGPAVVWALGGWLAGGVTDRVGQARTTVVSLLLGAGCAVAAAVAPNAGVFAVARTVGAGAQVATLAAVSAALRSTTNGFGRAVGTSFMTTRFSSGAVAPAVVAAGVAMGSWRLAFVADALLLVVLAWLVAPLREAVRPPRPHVASLLAVSRGAVVGGVLAVAAVGIVMTVPGLVTVESSALASSSVQVTFGILASVATFAAGALADRYTAWRVAIAGLAVGGVGAAAVALGAPLFVGLVPLAAASGTVPLGLVVLPLLDAPPERHGTATAMPRFLGELAGGGLATVILVRLGHDHGIDAALGGLALVIALVLAVAVVIRGKSPVVRGVNRGKDAIRPP